MNNGRHTDEQAPIKAWLVAEGERMDFLPAFFGKKLMMRGEAMVYAWMRSLCDDYIGGMWDFFKLSNGGFYMAPQMQERLKIQVVGNWFDGEVSADGAGIIATLFALGQLCAEADSEGEAAKRLYQLHRRLLAYAAEHPESAQIGSAID